MPKKAQMVGSIPPRDQGVHMAVHRCGQRLKPALGTRASVNQNGKNLMAPQSQKRVSQYLEPRHQPKARLSTSRQNLKIILQGNRCQRRRCERSPARLKKSSERRVKTGKRRRVLVDTRAFLRVFPHANLQNCLREQSIRNLIETRRRATFFP